jgi:hypothetical protein
MHDIKSLLHNNFLSFFVQSFAELNPGKELTEYSYVRYIAYLYEHLTQGARFVVNLPPRSGKTVMAIAYALWRIGRDPTEKVLFVCNNKALAEKHVFDARKILRSVWYKQVFPKTRIAKDRTAISHLETTLGGGFFAASVESSLGGVGATVIISDDANRIDEAHKPEMLERVNDKFDGEVLSRLNPLGKKKQRGIVLNLQHRIAENDLSAHLIGKGFSYIALALEAPRTRTYSWGDETWERQRGHVLTENYSESDLERLRSLQHPPFYYFFQQGQGRNAVIPITEAHFRLIDRRNSQGPFVISIDAALGEMGSFNVAQVWDVSTQPLHLRRQFRAQCSYVAFALEVRKLITRFRPAAVLVEKAANGFALVSQLRDRFPLIRFVEIQPVGSKSERLSRHRKAIAEGAISLQAEDWYDDFILEFMRHPALGSDQVDATTLLLDWGPQRHQLAPAEPLFAGVAGVSASTMKPIVTTNRPFSSNTPGIVRALKKPFFRKW